MKFKFLFILLAIFVSINITASEYVGKVPSIIEVQNNKKIEKEAILNKVKSKIGSTITQNQIKEDINSIYGTGYFDKVEVFFDDTSNKLIYKVKERPSIIKIDFEGNTQLKSDDLKETIKVKEYEIYDPKKVQVDIDSIIKQYEEKGYYLAKISHEVEKTDNPDEIKLKYKIRDFDKVKIRKINFINNRAFKEEELKKAFMITGESTAWSFLSGRGNYRENAFKADADSISRFYLDRGYVKFKYDQPIVTLSEDKKWAYITMKLDEGKPYKIGKIDFSGDMLFAQEDLMKELTLREGDLFSLTKRNNDIQKLSEMYQDLGYAFVNVIPNFEIHDENLTVDVTYNFEKGKLVHFRKIQIIGNTKTRDKVVRREMRIAEGELYNGTNLRKSKENVERLGYFGQNEVVFQTKSIPEADDLVDIIVSVKEKGTGTFTLGLGYSTVSGVYINSQIAENNLFGRGHILSFGLNMTIGGDTSQGRDKSFNLGFTEPYLLDTDFSLGGDVFYNQSHKPESYTEDKKGFDVRGGYPIGEYTRLYTTYRLEQQKIYDIKAITVNPDIENGYLSSIAFTLERDKRNNRMEPTSGNYQSITAEFAGLGGDKFFGKTKGALRWYMPIFDTEFIYRSNYEVGNLFKLKESKQIPMSEKYYLGGSNSLKGFEFYAISPKDQFGNTVGGLITAHTSQEIEYPLIKEAGLKWVMFFDAGNVWDNLPNQFNKIRVKADVGFGFRWFSPIGPLRFEWGFPLNRRESDKDPDYTFNFYIGPPF